MPDDSELLRRFTQEKSEAAFAELVQRYLRLVYAVALRRVGGDTHLAQDVTQMVFANLARQAARLLGHGSIAGWLHTDARFRASSLVRSERRRQEREQKASLDAATDAGTDGQTWRELREVLDEALGALNDTDRTAILLRYFHGLSHAELAEQWRLSESSARARTDRALERLRHKLQRRGIASTAAALAATLPLGVMAEVPAELAASTLAVALSPAAAGAAAVATPTSGGLTLFAMNAASLVLTASVAVNALLVGYLYWPVSTPTLATRAPATATAPPRITQAVVSDEIVTDPRRIVAEMRRDGFSESLVQTAIRFSVPAKYRIPPALADDRVAPRSRWNRSPPYRPETAAKIAEYKALERQEMNFLGYIWPFSERAATAAGLNHEKARVLSAIDDDYEQIFEGTLERFSPNILIQNAAAQDLAMREYERDVRTLLTPTEAEIYLSHNQNWMRNKRRRVQHEAGNSRQALVDLAAGTRASLGDEKFVTLMSRFSSDAAAADPIYLQAGLGSDARADLFLATYREMIAVGEAKAEAKPALATAARQRLTAGVGLSAEQTTAFDQTSLGEFLRRAGAVSSITPTSAP